MMLVKLGGSVITEKASYRTFREQTCARLAKEIVDAEVPVIIVHGAGSFGHVLAKQYGLQKGGEKVDRAEGVARVSYDVRELDLMVLEALHSSGLNAVALSPGSCAILDGGKLKELDVEKFRSFLGLGVAPVTYGDVVLDRKQGVGICSGDQLMMELAKSFRPERTIFVADVDGVFDKDPHLHAEAKLLHRVDQTVVDRLPRSDRHDDVTGSIYGKLQYMLELSAYTQESMILNGNVPGRLRAALRGEDVICTRVGGFE